jgi:PhnB protein
MAGPAQTIIPHLVVGDASAALAFYVKALGATETMRMPSDDGKRILHSQIEFNGALIFIRDDFPEYRAEHGDQGVLPPSLLGGTSVTMHVDVPNCDEAIDRMAAAGAKILMPPGDMFWGARYGMVMDPFGHAWSFAHPLPPKA